MNKIAIILAFISILTLLVDSLDYEDDFSRWFKTYKSSMESSSYDKQKRLRIWKETDERIKKHNERYAIGLETYEQAHNELSDMTYKEFLDKFIKGRKKSNDTSGKYQLYAKSEKKNPASVDWVKAGYVNQPKNQGSCGSCYVFAAIGAIEGQVKRYFNQLPKLSTQQVVSCGPNGCNGGEARVVYSYLNVSGGSLLDNYYPYTSGNTKDIAGKCQTRSPVDQRQVAAKILGTVAVCDYPDGKLCSDESFLEDALANAGPVSVGIYVDEKDAGMMSYKRGVYTLKTYSQENSANHDVLAVGYGVEPGTGKQYFSIMNSWGPTWGMNGVMWIARNQNFMIGIGQQVFYPKIDTSYSPSQLITTPPPQPVQINSKILKSSEYDMVFDMLYADSLVLLYRGSRDGFTGQALHSKCDGQFNTFVLIKPSSFDNVFGAFASSAIDSKGKWLADTDAFIFSLRRDGFSEANMFPVKRINNALIGYAARIPLANTLQFGKDLTIVNDMKQRRNTIANTCLYYNCPEDLPTKYAPFYFSGTNLPFIIQEIEVFKISYSID